MKFTMIRRITALGLILVLAAGIPIQASSASTEKVTEDAASTKSLQEAQDEKAQLEKALKEAQSTIEDLRDSKGDIESKVTELNQQLIDISARITDLENQLTAKSEDIQETKDELAGAKEREAQQYADMKVRIQFMYENGQTSYLEALLSSRNISEFLNSADYIAQIQSYDRQKLTEYQDTVESIVNLEAQLEQEYTDLEALKSTVESNKATVAAMMRQKESELADAHIYDRHVPIIRELIEREQHPAPKFTLNPDVKDFYQFTTKDITIEDYVTGPQIKNIPIAV